MFTLKSPRTTLWFIDLTVPTCHIQYPFLSLCHFLFTRKRRKHKKYSKSAIFVGNKNGRRRLLGAQSINAERASCECIQHSMRFLSSHFYKLFYLALVPVAVWKPALNRRVQYGTSSLSIIPQPILKTYSYVTVSEIYAPQSGRFSCIHRSKCSYSIVSFVT